MEDKKLTWWNFQLSNPFIYLFILFFILFVIELTHINYIYGLLQDAWAQIGNRFIAVSFTIMGILLPPTVSALLFFKGIIQFWNDYNTGKSR